MTSTSSLDTPQGRILHEDCVAGMNSLSEGSADLVFADPPFNIGYDYDVYRDEKEDNEYLTWSREWITAVHRVLKPSGTFWLAIGDEYAAELKLEAQRVGFHTRSWVIWYYTFGVNCKTKFSRSHAHLFYFVKDPKKFTFLWDELENRIPSARQLVYGDRRANPIGRLPDDTWILRPQDLADRFTPDEDTWYFPRVAGTFKERAGFHGCQMPEQLLGRIIRACSRPGDMVLDPFSGSATTLAVAKKLGRRFLGFDLSEDYVNRGIARLAGICLGDRLEGATEPTISAPASAPPRSRHRSGKSPLEDCLEDSSVAWNERSHAAFVAAILDNFRGTHGGHSVERVIADPTMNQGFLHACTTAGLPGNPCLWNWALLRARHTGLLEGVVIDQRTELSWETCDPILFASEIAWKNLIDQGYSSLEEILCDPRVAERFDQYARDFSPGFTPFEYRWSLLKLFRETELARERLETIGTKETPPGFDGQVRLEDEFLARLPSVPAIYLISSRADFLPLYVGCTWNLHAQVNIHLAARGAWDSLPGGNDRLLQYSISSSTPQELFLRKNQWGRLFKPRLDAREDQASLTNTQPTLFELTS